VDAVADVGKEAIHRLQQCHLAAQPVLVTGNGGAALVPVGGREFTDLSERHPGRLRDPDQAGMVEGVFVVVAMTGTKPAGNQHAHLFPVPQHVRLDAQPRCRVADAHACLRYCTSCR